MNWSERDHFVYSYNSIPFSDRESPQDRFAVSYGSISRPPMSFREECLRAAGRVAEDMRSHGMSVVLLFSGGMDSEVVLRSLLEVGVRPQAVSCRFKGGFNDHDLAFAERACRSLGVDHRILELDLLPFWQGQGLDYADQVQCVVPSYLSTMWAMDQVEGFLVTGMHDVILSKKVPQGYRPGIDPYPEGPWFLKEREADFCLHRFCNKWQRPSCLSFFKYTPELMLSFLEEPVIVDLVANRRIGKLFTYSSKWEILSRHFFLEKREKWDGFEKIRQAKNEMEEFLIARFPGAHAHHLTEYDSLVEHLRHGERAEPSTEVASLSSVEV